MLCVDFILLPAYVILLKILFFQAEENWTLSVFLLLLGFVLFCRYFSSPEGLCNHGLLLFYTCK